MVVLLVNPNGFISIHVFLLCFSAKPIFSSHTWISSSTCTNCSSANRNTFDYAHPPSCMLIQRNQQHHSVFSHNYQIVYLIPTSSRECMPNIFCWFSTVNSACSQHLWQIIGVLPVYSPWLHVLVCCTLAFHGDLLSLLSWCLVVSSIVSSNLSDGMLFCFNQGICPVYFDLLLPFTSTDSGYGSWGRICASGCFVSMTGSSMLWDTSSFIADCPSTARYGL